MLTIYRLHDVDDQHPCLTLTLSYDLRQKSRQLVILDNGQEAQLFLPRGIILRHGDQLIAETGEIIRVLAAKEQVSTVKINDALLLGRICYHLGNRHVPLQITTTWCRYQHDHVLDDMVKQLGADIIIEQAMFEPESGAYHSHTSVHHHAHKHTH